MLSVSHDFLIIKAKCVASVCACVDFYLYFIYIELYRIINNIVALATNIN